MITNRPLLAEALKDIIQEGENSEGVSYKKEGGAKGLETMRANPPKHWLPTTIKVIMTNLGGGADSGEVKAVVAYFLNFCETPHRSGN